MKSGSCSENMPKEKLMFWAARIKSDLPWVLLSKYLSSVELRFFQAVAKALVASQVKRRRIDSHEKVGSDSTYVQQYEAESPSGETHVARKG